MSTQGCTADTTEPYALRVLGESMVPEFEDGAVIIVDPAAPCESGAYAIVEYDDDVVFRQYVVHDGRKFLRPLNDDYPTVELRKPFRIRGVVIQKYYRRRRKHYDWESGKRASGLAQSGQSSE